MQVGYVAMIEVVALMVGQIDQRYSEERYDDPQAAEEGNVPAERRTESAVSPGKQHGRSAVSDRDAFVLRRDLVRNQQKAGVNSRYSAGFGQPVVETDVKVRSLLAYRHGGATMIDVVFVATLGGLLVGALVWGIKHASVGALADDRSRSSAEKRRRRVAKA